MLKGTTMFKSDKHRIMPHLYTTYFIHTTHMFTQLPKKTNTDKHEQYVHSTNKVFTNIHFRSHLIHPHIQLTNRNLTHTDIHRNNTHQFINKTMTKVKELTDFQLLTFK